MRKELKKRAVFFSVICQIFLLIGTSFAFAFLISDNFVNAAGGILGSSAPAQTTPTPVYIAKTPSASIIGTGSSTQAAALSPIQNFPAGGITIPNTFEVNNPTFGGLETWSQGSTIKTQVYDSAAGKWQLSGTYSDGTTWSESVDQGTFNQILTKSGYQQIPQAQAKILGIGPTVSGGFSYLVQGLNYAILVAGVIQLIGPLIGLSSQTTKALTVSAIGGIIAGKAVGSLGAAGFGKEANLIGGKFGNWLTGGYGQFTVGAIVAIAIFIAMYSSESKKLVNFQCLPFEPPLGGSQCEQCNKDPFRPCSEYRCRSLGQACQLLNAGTGQEQCAWVGSNDVKSPTITPWDAALSPFGLKYLPDTAVRPPAIGTKIVTSSGGCLPAFTPLQFGITTDEPSQCKIDYNHTSSFDDMQYYFGGSNYYAYNHTEQLRLPGPDTGNNSIAPEIKNDGSFSLYARCRDANGNFNVDEYAFSFCVDKGPDTTPPVIEGFSIPSGSYVGFNQNTVPIELYVNEPSECKWSTQSKAYDDMENSLTCFTQSYQVNANLQYTCYGNVTGVTNNQDNNYYFRCKDQPGKPDNQRNVDVQSTLLDLKGSQPLVILSASPNSTITGSADTVPVTLQLETSAGAQGNGNATCYFSPTGENDSYIAMFETNSYLHSQDLNLPNGNYNYYFRCIDLGGNAAEANTTFSVSVDKQAPQVTRVYKQDALKIVTDESAECSYSLTSCNFDISDGLKMIYSNPDIRNNLYAEWKPSSTYYIRCRDLFGNEPSPNQCSIVVSAVTLTGKSS